MRTSLEKYLSSESGYEWDIEENNGKYLTLKNCSIILEDVEEPGFVKEEAWERGCVRGRTEYKAEMEKTVKGEK